MGTGEAQAGARKSKRGQDQRGKPLRGLKVKAEPSAPPGCLSWFLSNKQPGSQPRLGWGAVRRGSRTTKRLGKRVLSTQRGKAGLRGWGVGPWWEMRRRSGQRPHGSLLLLRTALSVSSDCFARASGRTCAVLPSSYRRQLRGLPSHTLHRVSFNRRDRQATYRFWPKANAETSVSRAAVEESTRGPLGNGLQPPAPLQGE